MADTVAMAETPGNQPPAWRLATALGLLALAHGLMLQAPAAAQSAEDWNSAPLAIPQAPGPDRETPARPPVLQAPSELRRPQAPLQPGQSLPPAPSPWQGSPTIRIAPGPGLRPQPRPASPPRSLPPLALPPAASSRPPATPQRLTPSPVLRVPTPSGASPPPPAVRQPPRQAFPSYLEMLPPGTIQPLPGEVLPGSEAARGARAPQPRPDGRPPQAESPPSVPPPSVPPQVVPPPPWRQGGAPPPRGPAPWTWLLLGMGIGGAGMFLLQQRQQGRRQPPPEGALQTLGLSIEPRPDPGVPRLVSLAPAGEPAFGSREV